MLVGTIVKWRNAQARLKLAILDNLPDDIKTQIRDLLRHGGFKPSGRSKPASEYLVSAVQKGRLDTINPAVDCCNVASLHSGLPISVVDIGRGTGPWRIGIAEAGKAFGQRNSDS